MTPAPSRAYPNGIDGTTGQYLLEPLSPEQLVEIARSPDGAEGDAHRLELKRKHERATRPDQALAVGDPRDLSDAGWGVIFAQNDPTADAVYAALKPLIELRQRQASVKEPAFFREYRGAAGVAPGETKQDFLSRHGVGLGMPADPAFMPYYLLIIGSPQHISFRFQYELDVEYAVGRVSFPTLEEYERYAKAVAAAEDGEPNRGRTALLFAAQSPGDRATDLSAEKLVAPLDRVLRNSRPAWQTTSLVGQAATRDRLRAALASDAPTVLFTASHGLYFPPGDPRHADHLGALLCSDWPGRDSGPVARGHYFAADDLPADARLGGTLAIHFACFGAGVPAEDDFPHERLLNHGRPLADPPFVSALPRALLAHRNGGCLAVVGHIERA
jgi:hypothetical protein